MSTHDIKHPERDSSPLGEASREREAERAARGTKTDMGSRNVWVFAVGFALFGILLFYFGHVAPPGTHSTSPGAIDLGRLQDEFLPQFKSGIDAYKGFTTLSGGGVAIAEDIGAMTNIFPDLLAHRRGGDFLAILKHIDKNVSTMQDAIYGLDVSLPALKSQLPFDIENALSFRLHILQAKQFLGLAIPWLEDPRPHHVAIFFANTSELRPGGGFLGSYVDLEIADASIASYIVHDINDIDRTFAPNFVPPVPLQTIEKVWRVADANWFFDVPTSARKVVDFMNMSDLAKASGTHFEGAIFVSPRVVGDLLSLTGPITLTNASITITADNFLMEIQSQVQAGQSGGDPHPKKILSELAPILLGRLATLSKEAQSRLLGFLGNWVTARDLLVYAENDELESMLDYYGASGKAYTPPANFQGDYLAIVNANVGGGKTDLYMKTDVALESHVGLDGVVSDHLTVTRTHTAGKNAAWWYRVPNVSYQMIHTGSNAKFVYGKSSLERHVVPPLNYKREGYQVDPDVAALESRAEEIPAARAFTQFSSDGKNIFGTWSKTSVGKTTTTTLDYTRRLPDTLASGSTYTFVLERQQGDRSHYHISIAAPPGYVWKEINLPIFDYKEDEVPGRVTITLTLQKI